ncbi:MAG: hypothetical protein HY237_12180 [Acidobacteria bacterium]|nr:hypothetical protein [Acidobacteriota bacterium]
MLQRFAAGSAIASMAIALLALVVLLTPVLGPRRFYPVTIVWCLMPLVWGLWAMLTPKAWVPQRLPLWGAILGLAAGLFVAFVLNVHSLVLGEPVPARLRGLWVLLLVAFYYLLWMLVRVTCKALNRPPPGA